MALPIPVPPPVTIATLSTNNPFLNTLETLEGIPDVAIMHVSDAWFDAAIRVFTT